MLKTRCCDYKKRFNKVINDAGRAIKDVDGVVGEEITQLIGRLDNLTEVVYSKWSSSWVQKPGKKQIALQQDNALSACRELKLALSHLIDIFKLRKQEEECNIDQCESSVWNDDPEEPPPQPADDAVPAQKEHSMKLRSGSAPKTRSQPSEEPSDQPPPVKYGRYGHTNDKFFLTKQAKDIIQRGQMEQAMPSESSHLDEPLFENEASSFTATTFADSSTTVKEEVKEEEMDIKEEPIDDEFPEIKEEPISDLYCYNTGTSRPADWSSDDLQCHEEMSPQPQPVDPAPPRPTMMKATKTVSVKGSIRVNRDGMEQMAPYKPQMRQEIPNFEKGDPADPGVLISGSRLVVRNGSMQIDTYRPKPVATSEAPVDMYMVERLVKVCYLCDEWTHQYKSVPRNGMLRYEFLKKIITITPTQKAKVAGLKKHYQAVVFCQKHIAVREIPKRIEAPDSDIEETEEERRVREACTIPRTFRPTYNREFFNLLREHDEPAEQPRKQKRSALPRCSLCDEPMHPTIPSPHDMTIARTFFNNLVNLSDNAHLTIEDSIINQERLTVCRRHIKAPAHKPRPLILPVRKLIPKHPQHDFGLYPPPQTRPPPPPQKFDLLKNTAQLVKNRGMRRWGTNMDVPELVVAANGKRKAPDNSDPMRNMKTLVDVGPPRQYENLKEERMDEPGTSGIH